MVPKGTSFCEETFTSNKKRNNKGVSVGRSFQNDSKWLNNSGWECQVHDSDGLSKKPPLSTLSFVRGLGHITGPWCLCGGWACLCLLGGTVEAWVKGEVMVIWWSTQHSKQQKTGWWFQIFFIFTPIWWRFPIWLIFFKWVETTNQKTIYLDSKS